MTAVLAVAAALGLVAIVARFIERSWVGPAVVYAVLWGGYLVVACLFIVDFSSMSSAGIWVLMSAIAVTAGSAFSRGFPLLGWSDRSAGPAVAIRNLTLVTGLLVLAGLVEVLVVFARTGFSVSTLITFTWIAQVSAANRASFGYGDLTQSVGERVLFGFVYAAPLFGGLLLRFGHGWLDRALSVASVTNAVLVALLYGSRMGALYGSSCWVGAYLAGAVSTRAGDLEMVRVAVRSALIALVAVLGLSTITMVIRYAGGGVAKTSTEVLGDPFAFVAGFGVWTDRSRLLWSDFLLGYRTFTRPFELLGVYHDPQQVIDVGFTSTNIFTALRGLIEDFGSVGALLFLFWLGACGGTALRRVGAGRRGWIPVLTTTYAFILTTPSHSLFVYTTVLFGLGLFFAYFAWCQARPALSA